MFSVGDSPWLTFNFHSMAYRYPKISINLISRVESSYVDPWPNVGAIKKRDYHRVRVFLMLTSVSGVQGHWKFSIFLSSLKNQKEIEILDMFIIFFDKHISFKKYRKNLIILDIKVSSFSILSPLVIEHRKISIVLSSSDVAKKEHIEIFDISVVFFDKPWAMQIKIKKTR